MNTISFPRRLTTAFALWTCLLAADAADPPITGNRRVPEGERPKFPGLEKLLLCQNSYGHILCENEEQASEMLANLERAAALFRERFGADPAEQPGKGLYFRHGILPAGDELKLLAALQANWMLPFLDGDSVTGGDGLKDITRRVREQLKSQSPGVGEVEIERMLEQRMPMIAKLAKAEFNASRHGVNAHELGHMYFMNTYWPSWLSERNCKPAPPEFYGSPAPDWLDEAAATLTEGNALARTRWAAIRAIVADDMNGLRPLAELTTMRHPQKRSGEAEGGEDAPPPPEGVAVKASIALPGTGIFYAHCRVFAEFLADRSGRAAIMGDIARSDASGIPFARWLAASGPSNHLPPDINALDTVFRAWLRERVE